MTADKRGSVRIQNDGGPFSRVHLDGADITAALDGVDLKIRGDCMPTVTLDVLLHQTDVELTEASVVIPQESHDLLLKLGWTPPEEPAE